MNPPAAHPEMRIVVLKRDRLYGEMIRAQIVRVWPGAQVQVFQKGFDALDAIQASVPDLFVTGARADDMDGLEHLEPFIHTALPILIVTSAGNDRFYRMLWQVRYNGVYDGSTEGLENLPNALLRVVNGQSYASPNMLPRLWMPKDPTRDALTKQEQVVLSAIGSGSDDKQAAGSLRVSAQTVGSHRKAIMRKLGLHQKGELMVYALQRGYVLVTPTGVFHPGFQRRLAPGAAGRPAPSG